MEKKRQILSDNIPNQTCSLLKIMTNEYGINFFWETADVNKNQIQSVGIDNK